MNHSICLSCEFLNKIPTANPEVNEVRCGKNNQPIDVCVKELGCPVKKFKPSEQATVYVHRRQPHSPQLPKLVLSLDALYERQQICEQCPSGEFSGWLGTMKTIVKCNAICRPCNTKGLISITIHKCPRGHHED